MVYYSLRTEKESEIQRVCDAGVAEQADARDLKSRDAKASYRFDPGHRHHRKDRNHYRGVEQLVARRAHNPEVVRFKSHPRNQSSRTKVRELYLLPLHSSLFTCHRSFGIVISKK